MSTMEEKLDNIFKLLDAIKKDHAKGKKDLRKKLEWLKHAMQKVVKWLKDRTLIFKKKGNERQFLFNNNVKDQIDDTRKHLNLL